MPSWTPLSSAFPSCGCGCPEPRRRLDRTRTRECCKSSKNTSTPAPSSYPGCSIHRASSWAGAGSTSARAQSDRTARRRRRRPPPCDPSQCEPLHTEMSPPRPTVGDFPVGDACARDQHVCLRNCSWTSGTVDSGNASLYAISAGMLRGRRRSRCTARGRREARQLADRRRASPGRRLGSWDKRCWWADPPTCRLVPRSLASDQPKATHLRLCRGARSERGGR